MGEIWRLDFIAFIGLLKILGPLVLFYAISKSPGRSWVVRVSAACAMEVVWLLVTFSRDSSLESEVEKVGFVGVASMALLSGWGAVAGPYQYGPWFRKAFSDEEIESADARLQNLLDMVAKHKRDWLVGQQSQGNGNRRKTASGVGYFPFLRKPSPQEERIASLESLANELFLERVEMRFAKASFIFSQTLLGKTYTLAGYLFALYCVFRVGAALWSLVFPRGPNDPDVVTRAIALLFVTGSLETRRLLAQVVSFILVGVMVFNSFRGLLITLGKLFHQVGVLDSTVVSLLLMEVMGQFVSFPLYLFLMCACLCHRLTRERGAHHAKNSSYMLSSIILLNLGLPADYRFEIFVQYAHFRRWFEILFLVAAVASTVLIAVSDKDKKSRTEFYGLNKRMHDKLP